MKRLVAALALVVCLTTPALGQESAVVRGRLLDARSGEPVATASVRVVGTVLLTFADDLGRFEIKGVPAGRRQLAVERLGYAPRQIELELRRGEFLEIDIALEPRAVAVGQVIASATKREVSTSDAPVSVAVLDQAEIRERIPDTAADAIRYAPSVQFVGEQLNIRGSSGYSRGTGTRVLLLVDGVPANAGDSGAMNWDAIPLTEISRIEVVKGAGSALYGTSALGGVINVVTTPTPKDPLTRVRLRAGFYDDPPHRQWIWSKSTLVFGSVDLSHGRRVGPLGFWLRAGRTIDDGFRENGDLKRTNVAFQADAGLASDTLGFFGSWARERYGASLLWCMRGECDDPQELAFQPLRVPTSARDDRTGSDKGRLHITHRRRWSDAVRSFSRFSFQRNDWQTDFGDSTVGAVSDRYGGELRWDWGAASWLFLTLGGETAHTEVDADLFGSHTLTDLALFAQGEFGATSWLAFTAGGRGDVRLVDGGSLSEPWSSQFSPRVGAVLFPDAETRIRASLGRGFRSPTVAELFTATEVGGFLVKENPNLRPERSWAGELGVQRLLTPWLAVNMAGFVYDFEGLIEADTVTSAGGTIEIRFDNLPEASIRGVEAIARLSLLGDRVRGQGAYTFLSTEDKSTGEPLPYRPKHLLTASGHVLLGSFDVGADYRLASAFDRVQVFTDSRLDPLLPMRVLDFRLAYHLGAQTVRLAVENALNYGYTTIERNLEPIRRATLAVELEF